MLKDITLGQYFPGTSPLHRMDPRTKLLAVMLSVKIPMITIKPLVFLVTAIGTLWASGVLYREDGVWLVLLLKNKKITEKKQIK